MEYEIMIDDIVRDFQQLCAKADMKWNNTFGTDELELDLLEILFFVKKNPGYRKDFARGFINIVNDYKYGPLEIVIFCMRDLRWEDVKKAASERQMSCEDPRIKSAMQEVLDVYKSVWTNADLYKYYSKKS